MARLARVVAPGIPHHVTQRGNRRQPVFFEPADYALYLGLLRTQAQRWGLQLWAYCLMTNHVHLIVVPAREDSLARGLGEAHKRYTRAINFRQGWRGYLWQGRFASVPLDMTHLVAAIRYVERNPVAAGLVAEATAYPWSSARAHVLGTPDPLLSPCFLSADIPDWRAFLADPEDEASRRQLEQSLQTGRPLGDPRFVTQLEQQLGRRLQKQRPGRKPRN